jgi:P27 family predicted phage terminase small subunit
MLNPLYRARSKATEEMDRCGMQLGLSPVARTKLTTPEEDQEPLAQLLRFAANDRRTEPRAV